jgi:hypothetical protein
LTDFINARKNNPDVPKNAFEICVTQAVADCMKSGFHGLGMQNIHLHLDQGESFRGHICDRIINPKVLRELPYLAEITSTAEADMRITPALQFADLLAWCVSHKQDVRTKWHERMLKNPHEDSMVDFNHRMNPLPRSVEPAKNWKLPRRKLHP